MPQAEWQSAKWYADASGSSLVYPPDPVAAVEGAHAVYTDTFVSMGEDEAREAQLLAAFQGFQVTPELMQRADPNAIFLHCLPAHRGQEVHPEVMDGPQSRVFDLAEYRMHTAAAVLRFLAKAE
jgi:ornithine carbamoyltransferase